MLWEDVPPTGLDLGSPNLRMRWNLQALLWVGAAGWKSKVLLGADLWAGDDLAVMGRGGFQPFAMDGAYGLGQNPVFYKECRQEPYRMEPVLGQSPAFC